jgi:hypothetical protein
MGPRPEPTLLDEIRILVRGLLWLVGLAVLTVLALSLITEFGDVCYRNCGLD